MTTLILMLGAFYAGMVTLAIFASGSRADETHRLTQAEFEANVLKSIDVIRGEE